MAKQTLIPVLVAILPFITAGRMSAQDIDSLLDKVREVSASAFVTVEYEAQVTSDGTVTGDKGIIEAQGDMWHLKGSLIELYTDTGATWVVDRDGKEAYVEPAWTYDDLKSFYQAVLSQGAELNVEILSLTPSACRPVSFFTPELSSDWIITDLR